MPDAGLSPAQIPPKDKRVETILWETVHRSETCCEVRTHSVPSLWRSVSNHECGYKYELRSDHFPFWLPPSGFYPILFLAFWLSRAWGVVLPLSYPFAFIVLDGLKMGLSAQCLLVSKGFGEFSVVNNPTPHMYRTFSRHQPTSRRRHTGPSYFAYGTVQSMIDGSSSSLPPQRLIGHFVWSSSSHLSWSSSHQPPF